VTVSGKPRTIDGYLRRVRPDQRAALQGLRKAIKAAAPRAEECIAYDVPSFRLDGKYLVSFAAAARHCAFYPGGRAVETHGAELKARGYGLNKGTIRFQPEAPPPASLVRKLVQTRLDAVRRLAKESR
jgi:uncharacterized protein YdhG (YjbR/CyaY superfamily)